MKALYAHTHSRMLALNCLPTNIHPRFGPSLIDRAVGYVTRRTEIVKDFA